MSVRILPLLILLVSVCFECKPPEAGTAPETKNSCRLSTYKYTYQSEINPLGGDTKAEQTLAISYNDQGQQTAIYRSDLETVTSSTATVSSLFNENKITYELNNDGLVIKQISEFKGVINSSKPSIGKNVVVFQYDANGRVSKSETVFDLNDGPIPSKREGVYTYDTNGKLLSYVSTSTTYTSIDSQTLIYSYYFTNGVLTKCTLGSPGNEQEVNLGKLDNNGRFVEFGSTVSGTYLVNERFAYDLKGNLLQHDIFDGNSIYETYLYEYDDKVNPFSMIPPLKGHPNSGPYSRPTFEKMPNNVTKRSHNIVTEWNSDITAFDMTYNPNGLLVKKVARGGNETYQYTYAGCN